MAKGLTSLSLALTSTLIAGEGIALLYSSAKRPYYVGYIVLFLPSLVLMIIAAAKAPGVFVKNLYYLFISSLVTGLCYLGLSLCALIPVLMTHGKINVYAVITLALCALVLWKLRPYVVKLKQEKLQRKEPNESIK